MNGLRRNESLGWQYWTINGVEKERIPRPPVLDYNCYNSVEKEQIPWPPALDYDIVEHSCSTGKWYCSTWVEKEGCS